MGILHAAEQPLFQRQSQGSRPNRWRRNLRQPALRTNPARRHRGQQRAHQAITSYNTANGVVNSPWLFYKLVSVQASPFDVSAKSPTDPVHSPAVFYQSNIVVETNYTLQQFRGRISNSTAGTGAPTSLGGLPPPNVVTPAPPNIVGVNMGGCMGCHGNAQVTKGTDFSFILAEGPTTSPDAPSPIGDAQFSAKFLDLFAH